MVSVVRTLQQQPSSPDDDAAPGFILANTGQLVWMPALRRTLTMVGALGAPMPSAVHAGAREDEDGVLDRVPGNRDACDHLRTIFEEVIPALASADASLDVVAVGDGADALERYLDWSVTWNRLSGRINSLAIVGGYHDMDELKCQGFRQFMREVCLVINEWSPASPHGSPRFPLFLQYIPPHHPHFLDPYPRLYL